MKKYTIGRGKEQKQPNNTSRKAKKAARNKAKAASKKVCQEVICHNNGDSTMRFPENFSNAVKYAKLNEEAYPDKFYTEQHGKYDFELHPNSKQNRPIFTINGKRVEDIKSRKSIHERFIEEDKRRKATKEGLSENFSRITGKSTGLPEIADRVFQYAAPRDIGVDTYYHGKKEVPTEAIAVKFDLGSRRGGKKNKKNKTRRK